MKIFDGKKLADKIAAELKTEIDKLGRRNIVPNLVIIAVEPDERSRAYIKAKVIRAKDIGIKTEVILKSTESIGHVKTILAEIAEDESVHGIIVQLPLPSHFNEQELIDFIPPEKDVDGLTTTSAKLLTKDSALFTPATPLAILEILKRNNINITDKTIAIIGQGKLVGAPLVKILEGYQAKVLTADKTARDLTSITQNADIIISAAGQPKLIKAEMIKDGATVIDAGISIVGGKSVGDVDFDNVAPKVSFITPVVGGVGPMTVMMLMQNVITAARRTIET